MTSKREGPPREPGFLLLRRALHSAAMRRRNAVGFSANRRPASRAADFKCTPRRSWTSGVRRHRYSASSLWCCEAGEYREILAGIKPVAQALGFLGPSGGHAPTLAMQPLGLCAQPIVGDYLPRAPSNARPPARRRKLLPWPAGHAMPDFRRRLVAGS